MRCCSTHSRDSARFFSWFARRSGNHYRRKGLGTTQRQLVGGIAARELEGASVLEIGCGVGYLHHSMLNAGAASATGVDLSEKMITEARALAHEQGLSDRTDYRLGDFVAMAEALPVADVTILDKVVCCYPDAKTLIARSTEKTARVYALTYPRVHLLNRIMTALEALFLTIIRCDFRPYLHDSGQIEGWIEAAGFRKRSEHTTRLWLTQVYAR